jgi:hypothetical protein
MRSTGLLLAACIGLAACASAPASVATTPAQRATAGNQLAYVAAVPRPVPASPELNIADFMFGPPPHTRIDPRMRCRFDCPIYPANLPPPVH